MPKAREAVGECQMALLSIAFYSISVRGGYNSVHSTAHREVNKQRCVVGGKGRKEKALLSFFVFLFSAAVNHLGLFYREQTKGYDHFHLKNRG